ncbi:MAG: TetR/AcrR family transcriptional regulator [Henriciella sp.]|nr:TetR/AcrR family transcriptional regulator [Henriciella sp.]
MTTTFVRARNVAQKRERRESLLAGAKRAVEKKGVDRVSLSDFSAEAGIAKSAFYKYFSSKEEILAYVLMREFDDITRQLAKRTTKYEDVDELASNISSTFAERPLACALLSEISRTLDQNTPFEKLINVKRHFAKAQGEWTLIILNSGLGFDQSAAKELVKTCYAYIAGLWSLTRERPELLEASRQAGFTGTYDAFETELKRFIVLQAAGILSFSESIGV